MDTVASSAKVRESRLVFEKSGAGGSGRRGLPPYLEDGVPGRGLPSRSEGSYVPLTGGGLERSDLERSDLDRSDLERSDLDKSDLERSDLDRSDLERSDLLNSDLVNSDLVKSDNRDEGVHGR